MNTRETHATIERIRHLSKDLQRIDLGLDKDLARLKPGQSLLARPGDGWDPYLAENWVPVALDKQLVTIERPAGVKYLAGQAVTLLGPVGAPYPMRPGMRSLLLMALDTPPTPLILLTSLAVHLKIEVTLVLGGRARDYPVKVLPPEVEVVEGDLDSGWPNQVTTVGWADQVIAVAHPRYRHQIYPALLEKLRQLRADIPKRFVLGIFDLPMPCGVGACGGCGVTCKDGTDRLICADGPAMDLEEVSFG